jgi:hypothetical protein
LFAVFLDRNSDLVRGLWRALSSFRWSGGPSGGSSSAQPVSLPNQEKEKVEQ